MVMMDEQKTKYEDLDATYNHHKIQTARRIKQLTKDMYTTQYKKCNSFLFITNLFGRY